MNKLFTLFCFALLSLQVQSQCSNSGAFTAGSLTPPGVGQSTVLLYNAGQYALAYVYAGANYNVTTCNGSSGGGTNYDTQLTVYDDATGQFLAYNDDYCGLESNTSFTAPRCGYVRVILMQYYCNSSGLPCNVTMTQNTAGFAPVTSTSSQTNNACYGGSMGAAAIMASGGSGPYTYTWSPSGGNAATASGLTAGTYSYVVTDSLKCSPLTPSTLTITQPSSITVSPSASSSTVCASTTVTLSTNVTGGTGPYTYTWSTGSSASTATDSPVSNTTYTVLVTDASSCSASNSVAVAVNALPIVSASASPSSTLCAGSSITLSGSGAGTYTWTSGVTDGAAFTPTLTSYTVTGTDANGCMNMAVQSLTIYALPALTVSGSTAVCIGSSVMETASGALTYSWSSSQTTASVSVSPTVTTTYTVTGTDANGCTITVTKMISVNQLPVVSVSGSSVICTGSTTSETASGASTYSWSNGQSVPAISVSPTVTTTYTVTGTDVNGCSDTSVKTITVNALPILSVAASSSVICTGASSSLTAGGAASYTWSSGATTGSIVVTPSVNTTYTVTGIDLNGCSDTSVETITVNALPIISVTASNSVICAGASSSLTAAGATSYTWSTGATTGSIVVTPTVNATYTVTGIDANGCGNASVTTVTVNALPVLSVAATSTVICAGASSSLTASGATSYTWSTGAITGSIVVTPTVNATYTVTGMDANGCSNASVTTVTVNALPAVSASTSNTMLCSGSSASLTAGGAISYTWSTGATSGSISITPTVSTTYTVMGLNVNGCSNTATITQNVTYCTGIQELAADAHLLVYPNPNSGAFTIRTDADITLSILSATGQLVLTAKLDGANNHEVNVSQLANGIYFIISQDGRQAINQRLIVAQ